MDANEPRQLTDMLFRQTWWQYADATSWLDELYHWFNMFEGTAWLVFFALVLRRFANHRQSPMELYYALAFLTFALTDFREAWLQQSWLLWIKLLNLIALFLLRRHVMRRFYPDARLY